jgi:hypothetical protein
MHLIRYLIALKYSNKVKIYFGNTKIRIDILNLYHVININKKDVHNLIKCP